MFRIFEPSVDALHDAYRAPIIDVLHGTIRIFVLHIRSPPSMTPKEAARSKTYKVQTCPSTMSSPFRYAKPALSGAFLTVTKWNSRVSSVCRHLSRSLSYGRLRLNQPCSTCTGDGFQTHPWHLLRYLFCSDLSLHWQYGVVCQPRPLCSPHDLVKTGKVAGGTIAFNNPLVQLSFFFATWSAFHWGEFAMTAGWNRARASVDCK
jgi:hypothetical protein